MKEYQKVNAVSWPIAGLLGIAFVVLKLTHVIDWSWWWVTLPFWGVFALLAFVLGIAVIVVAIRVNWKKNT